MFYYDYKHLLEHLYWKHGTKSEFCSACGLKMWKFSKHYCYVLPIDDAFIENFENDDAVDDSSSFEEDSDNNSDSCRSLTVTEHHIDVNQNYSLEYHKAIDKPTDLNNVKYLDEIDMQHPVVQSYLQYSADQALAYTESPYCYCRKDVHDSQMIGCDDPTCTIQWFHFSCVGIRIAPEGEWLCPECRAKKSNKVICLYFSQHFSSICSEGDCGVVNTIVSKKRRRFCVY